MNDWLYTPCHGFYLNFTWWDQFSTTGGAAERERERERESCIEYTRTWYVPGGTIKRRPRGAAATAAGNSFEGLTKGTVITQSSLEHRASNNYIIPDILFWSLFFFVLPWFVWREKTHVVRDSERFIWICVNSSVRHKENIRHCLRDSGGEGYIVV